MAKKDKPKELQLTGWQAVMITLCALVPGIVVMLGGLGLLSLAGKTTDKGDSPQELMVVVVFTPIAVAAGVVTAYFIWGRPALRNKGDAQPDTDDNQPNQ